MSKDCKIKQISRDVFDDSNYTIVIPIKTHVFELFERALWFHIIQHLDSITQSERG